ncbi:MAG TPA: hypothetical protein VF669_18290 [Tepidisphaeraceae bacterium]|jgi:predicted DNA-binding protein (UPF0251 family)
MPRLVDSAHFARTTPFTFSVVSAQESRGERKPKKAKRHFPGLKLTKEELRNLRLALGPTLSLEQAALHAQTAPSTLKRRVCEGEFRNCVKREKPLVFLTERFFQELFRGTGE